MAARISPSGAVTRRQRPGSLLLPVSVKVASASVVDVPRGVKIHMVGSLDRRLTERFSLLLISDLRFKLPLGLVS